MLKKYYFWVGILTTSLVIANVVAGKVVMFKGIILPAAVVSYAFTFLSTDIISEKWGKEKASEAVKFGFVAQIFAGALIILAQHLPVAPFAQETQKAFNIILGQNFRFVIASLTAYLISQHTDVLAFHFLKEKFNAKWIRNNGSTITSQFIDTAIFITIAFWGNVPNLIIMILSQYIIKLILAVLDTPLFYLLTKEIGDSNGKIQLGRNKS